MPPTAAPVAPPSPSGVAFRERDYASLPRASPTRPSTRSVLNQYHATVMADPSFMAPPTLVLEATNDAKHAKALDLFDKIKIGRITSSKTPAAPNNGFFDSKVLSRTHAEVWAENGAVYLRDLGSSNGTFVNGKRLSDENQASPPTLIRTGDVIEFGVDILNEHGTDILFKKVTVRARIEQGNGGDAPHGMTRRESMESFATMKDSRMKSVQSTPSKSSDAAVKDMQSLIPQFQTQLAKNKKVTKDLAALKSEVDSVHQAALGFNVHELDQVKARLRDVERDHDNAVQNVAGLQQQLAQQLQNVAKLQVDNRELQVLVEQQQKQLHTKDHGDAAEALVRENAQLVAAKQALERRVNELEGIVKRGKLAAGANAAPTRQKKSSSSALWILTVLVVLISIAAYYFVTYMDGWTHIDQAAQTHLGMTVDQLTAHARAKAQTAVDSAQQWVAGLKEQYLPPAVKEDL
ncbi:hypothetical protein AMAG_01114 [Allomyces macrogynus ATCC 38327]|uniref:FHA domain-containing protein n=2 Tax=Allomyces macrogynus (strain ATCC 38327) TaxID=578462 RepID=A0A0L0RXW8_ALLM3|nr:hypothetical protein AMAG_01114 [Allomyces macrogynus ATCC 38327]|eukprot:KNE55198.1 hypothetical protein AMAG_01114 [Allomyces macrogynus ATCC 38327]